MNSQTGHIGFAVQAEKGTFVTPTLSTKYSNDSIQLEPQVITPPMEIGGGRDLTDMYPGPAVVTGGLEFDVRPNFVGLPLYLVSGAIDTSTLTTGVYQHVITPADDIPWFSAQKKVSDTYDVFDYTDLKLNSLTLSCEAGQQLNAKLDIRGLLESGNASPITPAYEQTEVLMWHSGEIKLEGTTICPKTFNMEINNNLEDDDFRICPTAGRMPGDLPVKARNVNFSVTIRPDDNDLYEKAVYGANNAHTLQKAVYSGAFWAKFESVNAITGAYKYSILIEVPKAFFQPFKIEPNGDDTIEHGLDMIAAKSGSSDIYTITVVNSVASYTA